jgi:hypothetical protein
MIHIYPKYHISNLNNLNPSRLDSNYSWISKNHLYFFNAKKAINYLIHLLQLKRDDEVCIFTSTDSNYVSTCVTATFFNYCKVSRVLTDKTKLVYIIHEFGIPHPKTKELVVIAREKKIPSAEDCAHAISSKINGEFVGNFSDFAIYSLAKHLPIDHGGLLVSNRPLPEETEYYDAGIAVDVLQMAEKYFPYLESLTHKRKENYKFLKQSLSDFSFKNYGSDIDEIVPYSLLLNTPNYMEYYSRFNNRVCEWHPIHVKDIFCIPIQPLCSENELMTIVKLLNNEK